MFVCLHQGTIFKTRLRQHDLTLLVTAKTGPTKAVLVYSVEITNSERNIEGV